MVKNPESSTKEYSLDERMSVASDLILAALKARIGFKPDRSRSGINFLLDEEGDRSTLEISRRFIDKSVIPPVITTESAKIHPLEGHYYYTSMSVDLTGRQTQERVILSHSPEAKKRITQLIKSLK